LMATVAARRLGKLVHTQHRAAHGAGTAFTAGGTERSLRVGRELSHWNGGRRRSPSGQTSAPDGPPEPKKTSSESSSWISTNS
jgi:hypothetical protein